LKKWIDFAVDVDAQKQKALAAAAAAAAAAAEGFEWEIQRGIKDTWSFQ
jgi:hypothetical protein